MIAPRSLWTSSRGTHGPYGILRAWKRSALARANGVVRPADRRVGRRADDLSRAVAATRVPGGRAAERDPAPAQRS